MGNPLMNMMNNSKGGNNPMQLISQFMNFKNNFQGDPNAKLNELINSGNYSQEQINQATQMAKQIAPMLKGFMK